MEYKGITLEECFIKYHTKNIACICDGDTRLVKFEEE